MDARTLVDLAQKGYAEPRQLLATLPGLYASNVGTLTDLIDRYYTQRVVAWPDLADRAALRAVSQRFHERAGTLTDNLIHNLDRFVQGAPVLRVAHTPDHFAYAAVYAEFIFLDVVAQDWEKRGHVAPCQLLFLVDCDDVADWRLHSTRFPDVDHEKGYLRLATPISEESYGQVIYSAPKPAAQTVKEWFTVLEAAITQNLKVLYRGGIAQRERGEIQSRLGLVEQEVWAAYRRASNLAEFNAFFLSRVLNGLWNIPVAIFPLSQVASLLIGCYEYLLQHYPEMVECSDRVVSLLQARKIAVRQNLRLNIKGFPLWYICPDCSTRVPVESMSPPRLDLIGQCPRCRVVYRLDLGTYTAPRLEPVRDRIVPKVLFDTMTDLIGWRMVGGVSYAGSAEHVLTNSLIAQEMGWPVPPETLIRPRSIYYGLAEARAALALNKRNGRSISTRMQLALQQVYFGRGTILYSALGQGFLSLLAMWRKHFAQDGCFYELSRGSPIFYLPDEAINLLEAKMRSFEQGDIPLHSK